MVELSPKQAGDLGWFGCIWQKDPLVQTCLGSKSQRSISRAIFISSVTVVPWRLSAILSWAMSCGAKVPELVETQAGTSMWHSSTLYGSTNVGPKAAWWHWHGTAPGSLKTGERLVFLQRWKHSAGLLELGCLCSQQELRCCWPGHLCTA